MILATIYIYIGIFINFYTERINIDRPFLSYIICNLMISSIFLALDSKAKQVRFILPLKIDITTVTKLIRIVSVISVIFFFIYYSKNGIPIFDDNVEISRVEALKSSKFLYYNILIGAPFILIYLFVFDTKRFFIFFAFAYFIASLFSGFRSLLVSFALVIIISAQIKYHIITIKTLKKYFKYIVLIIISLLVITYIRIPEEQRNISKAFDTLSYRIFLNNVDNLININNYFKTNSNLYGLTFLWDIPYLRLPIKYFYPGFWDSTFAVWMTEKLNPNFNANFIMTPTIFGIFISNFGTSGIIISNIFIYIFSKTINIFKHNLLGFPVFIFFCTIAFSIFSRGFFSVFSLFVIPTLIIYSIVIIFSLIKTK